MKTIITVILIIVAVAAVLFILPFAIIFFSYVFGIDMDENGGLHECIGCPYRTCPDQAVAKVEEIQQEEKKHNGNDIFHIKEKIYEMILYGNPQLKDFPKAERYVLAGDIRKTMYTMLEMAVRLEKKYHKKTTLQDLDIEVDVLRNLLRLAKDPNLYPNQKPCLDFHTWEVWMRKVDEIGRMIGGYTEWVNGREKQK